MKRMKALGVVEWHLTSRQAIYYLLSIGMPTAFYLFFSGMYQETPGAPAHFMRDYLLSMTAFSMMSTAIFSFRRFSPIDWSCLYRGPCGAACEYAPTGLGLSSLYSHPRKPSLCGHRSGLDPASF